MHSQGLRSNTFTLLANNHNSKHVRMRTYAKIYAKGKLVISFLTTDYDNKWHMKTATGALVIM